MMLVAAGRSARISRAGTYSIYVPQHTQTCVPRPTKFTCGISPLEIRPPLGHLVSIPAAHMSHKQELHFV